MKKYIKYIPIYLLILLFGTRVEAYTGATSIHENPKASEKGNYITLKHTVDVDTEIMTIEYSYDNKFIQLIGFIPTTNGECNLEKNTIECTNVKANQVIIYPVFKIINDLTANKDITATFNTISEQSTTKVTVRTIQKVIEATSIDIKEIKKDLKVGDTYQIEASISPTNANNKTITYTSSNNEIASVDEKGLVTAKGTGLAYITLASSSLRTVVELNISEEVIELEKISIEEKVSLKVGEEHSIVITYSPENTTVDKSTIKYATSDNKVAIVNSDGEIVGVGVGDATITATIGEYTATTKVTVIDETQKGKEESGNSAVVPCIITAALTFIITMVLMFIIKTKKNKKENDLEEDEKDNYTSFTI